MIFTAKSTFLPMLYIQNFEFSSKSASFSEFFSFVILISSYFCITAASLALTKYPRMAFWITTAASFIMISSILMSVTELKYEDNCWEKISTRLFMFLWIERLLLTLFSSDWSFFIARDWICFFFNGFSKELSLNMLAEVLQKDFVPYQTFFWGSKR